MDRTVCSVNASPCITPNAKIWLRYRSRLMLPEERMMLQAMPMKRHQELVCRSGAHTLCKLAGNAWCYVNFIPGFLSAAACVPMRWFD